MLSSPYSGIVPFRLTGGQVRWSWEDGVLPLPLPSLHIHSVIVVEQRHAHGQIAHSKHTLDIYGIMEREEA